jgi:hypothetical protein
MASAVIAVPLNYGHIDADADYSLLGEADDVSNPSDAVHETDMQAGTYAGQSMVDGTGRHDQGPSVHNMAGAPYGLPGYKESHDWVNDIDIFSPLVFEWNFYGASLDTPVTTEIESKTAWETYIADDSIKFPNCQVGGPDFDVNFYMSQNELTTISCGAAIKSFLSTGIYEGKKAYNAVTFTNDNENAAFAVNGAAGVNAPAWRMKPYNSWLPSDTFTWSLWAKNTAGSYSNNAWQMLLNIRLLNDVDTNHKLSLLSGGGNGDQVVMVYINKFSADGWMPCSPDDNAATRYHTPAGPGSTTVRATGASPGFEGTDASNWFGQAKWYHIAHKFEKVGSSYESSLYINGKKCVTTTANEQPEQSKLPTSGKCRSDDGNVDCGGPWIADHWSDDRVAEMANVRYFGREALSDEKIEALRKADINAMPCLEGSDSCVA